MSRGYEDDELPALEEGKFSASDIYNSTAYDADGNVVSTHRKMHEHGYVISAYGAENKGDIFTSMHRREVLSKAINAGELGAGNQEIVVDRTKTDQPVSQAGDDYGESSEHQEDWNFTYQNEDGEYIHRSEGGPKFDFRSQTHEDKEQGDNLLDAAAVFYSVVFDDGPLGITFVKQNNGKFVVTAVLDWSPGAATVKNADTIVAISKQVIDKRMKQSHLGDLIRNTERPMTVTFEAMRNGKKASSASSGDVAVSSQEVQREANEAFKSMHTTRAKAGQQIVFGVVWQSDDSRKNCYMCEADFTFFRRRHHCRKCGNLVCNSCSKGRATIRAHPQQQRVCEVCMAPKRDLSTAKGIHASVGSNASGDGMDDEERAQEEADFQAALVEEENEIETIRLQLLDEKQRNQAALDAQEAAKEAEIEAREQEKFDAAEKIKSNKAENAARYKADQSKKRGLKAAGDATEESGSGGTPSIAGGGGVPTGRDRRNAKRRGSSSMMVTTIEEGDEDEEDEDDEEDEEGEEGERKKEKGEDQEEGSTPERRKTRQGSGTFTFAKEALKSMTSSGTKGKKKKDKKPSTPVSVNDEVEEQANALMGESADATGALDSEAGDKDAVTRQARSNSSPLPKAKGGKKAAAKANKEAEAKAKARLEELKAKAKKAEEKARKQVEAEEKAKKAAEEKAKKAAAEKAKKEARMKAREEAKAKAKEAREAKQRKEVEARKAEEAKARQRLEELNAKAREAAQAKARLDELQAKAEKKTKEAKEAKEAKQAAEKEAKKAKEVEEDKDKKAGNTRGTKRPTVVSPAKTEAKTEAKPEAKPAAPVAPPVAPVGMSTPERRDMHRRSQSSGPMSSAPMGSFGGAVGEEGLVSPGGTDPILPALTCAFCKKTEPPMRCSRCKSIFYCDRQCQRAHWRRHKRECVVAPDSPVASPRSSTEAESASLSSPSQTPPRDSLATPTDSPRASIVTSSGSSGGRSRVSDLAKKFGQTKK
jgi:hypothetical protein